MGSKKVCEWYEELPEPYRSQALDNAYEASRADEEVGSLSAAISSGFDWLSSNEDREYWASVNEAIDNGDWKDGLGAWRIVEGWLYCLPEPYRSQALENIDEDHMESRSVYIESHVDCPRDALLCAFIFDKSPEGEEYWNDVVSKLEDGRDLEAPRDDPEMLRREVELLKKELNTTQEALVCKAKELDQLRGACRSLLLSVRNRHYINPGEDFKCAHMSKIEGLVGPSSSH